MHILHGSTDYWTIEMFNTGQQTLHITLCAPVSQEALESGCCRLDLHTRSWNQYAIHFYKGLNMEDASEKHGKLLFRMLKPEMIKFAKEPKL